MHALQWQVLPFKLFAKLLNSIQFTCRILKDKKHLSALCQCKILWMINWYDERENLEAWKSLISLKIFLMTLVALKELFITCILNLFIFASQFIQNKLKKVSSLKFNCSFNCQIFLIKSKITDWKLTYQISNCHQWALKDSKLYQIKF